METTFVNTQTALVMPIITVKSVDETRDFYVDKLQFDHMMAILGEDGQVDFCTVVRDGARIMLTRSETSEAPTPSAQLYISVPAVQPYYDQLVKAGVAVSAPEDMWWGDRVIVVNDPNGYKLWFYENVGTPKPPAGIKVV